MGLLLLSLRVNELDAAGLTVGAGYSKFGRFVESITFKERGSTMSSEDEAQAADLSSQVAQLRELIGGYRLTQLIYVAAKLGIADLLKDGPKLIDELADSTGANARNLYGVLRALSRRVIFAETGDGRFDLTPFAEPLQTLVADSLSGWAIITGCEWHRAWETSSTM